MVIPFVGYAQNSMVNEFWMFVRGGVFVFITQPLTPSKLKACPTIPTP